MATGLINSGTFKQGGSNMPTWMNNISIVRATTTNAGDSIKITSSGGTAFNANTDATMNRGSITLPGATAGQTVTFQITADVTILLTGAHWGIGTTGDITGALLRALAINDNGTLRWGVAYLGARTTILTTDTNAAPTSITLQEHVLTTAAVASATNSCREIGYVRANFDDTGGAAEDLWAIQTGINDVVTGLSADGLWQPWNTVQAGGTSPTTTHTRWTQNGRQVSTQFYLGITSNAATWTATLPTKNKTSNAVIPAGYTADNGAAVANGFVFLSVDSTAMDLRRSASANWTSSGTKEMSTNGVYEVGPAASFIE